MTFKTAPRKMKYLGVSLTKEVKDFNIENYSTLKKQIKRILENGKIPCFGVGRTSTVKMA